MALLFMDSFDHYASADILTKWTAGGVTGGIASGQAITAGVGRRSSGAWRWTTGTAGVGAYMRKALVATGATAVQGFAFNGSGAATSRIEIAAFVDGGTTQVSLCLNTDLTLSVMRGGQAGTVLGTTVLPVAVGLFGYLEWKVLIDPAAGTVDLRLNGVSLAPFPLTGLNTRTTAVSQWTGAVIGAIDTGATASPSRNYDYDDVYVLDGSGAAPLNTFLGDVRVDARLPTAPGASAAWTPLAGANWAAVDDAAPDGDTTYVSTATVGLTDTFVTQDAPVPGATIFGLQHCLNLKKMDAGVCTVAPVVRHSGVDYPGANISPSTAYGYGLVIAAVNPATGLAWVEADFNAAEFGYKRTA